MSKRLLTVLLCVLSLPVFSQVVINEVCSRNENTIDDQFGSSRDWIELYNAGPADVDLAGWYLSDSGSLFTKWSFPSITIQSNSYLIVFCSGTNLLTPPLHTNFKLSQRGEEVYLSPPSGIPTDSVNTPFLPEDWSFGRFEDGHDSLVFFNMPTPIATNNGSQSFIDYRSTTPVISPSTGYYSEATEVTISHPSATAHVTYTLNGSDPQIGSAEYTGPILVDSTMVVRSRAFDQTVFPSDIASAGYFFGMDSELPIISLITQREYLFDPDTGIYVFGPNASPVHPYDGANFWEQIDVPTWATFIEPDGSIGFDQKINIQMHGGPDARTRSMRPFRLLAERDFGVTNFNFAPFGFKSVDKFRRLVLRNSGADFLHTGFRDGIIHDLIQEDQLHIPTSGFRPVNCFINGEFFGLYNLREKIDRYYVRDNYGVDDDDIDMMGMADGLIEGDSVAYNTMLQYILNTDMTVQANFDEAATLVDLPNMVDYFTAEIALNNTDWPNNNLELWRERSDTGIWRYLFFDLDAALGGVSFVPVDQNALYRALTVIGSAGNDHIAIMNKLLTNAEFKRYFINRHLDLLNTTFSSERLLAKIAETQAELEPEVPRHFDKWNGELDFWYHSIGIFEDRATERPQYSRDHLRDYFNLNDQQGISLNIYPPGGGSIEMNSLSINEFPWSGLYLDGNDVDVVAVPTPGYTFSHWEFRGAEIGDEQVAALRFNPNTESELVAVFEGTDFGPNLQVYPDPISDQFNLSIAIPQAGRVTIDLLDAQGKVIERFMNKELLPGKLDRTYQLSQSRAGVHVLQVKGPGLNAAKRVIVLN